MKVVFIGSSSFGLKCLKEINLLKELNLVGVISAKEKFNISYSKNKVKNYLYSDLSKYCKDNLIPIKVMEEKMNEEGLLSVVKDWNPDIFIVAGWYHMIPRSWLDYRKSYGLHASLLPDYSGGAPLVWAIINGEKKTGITLFQMDTGVDSGPILGQAEEIIYDDDDIQSLYGRIELKGIHLIKKCFPLLASGKLKLKKQNESKRRIFPQRSPDDGLINFDSSHIDIKNFIRAQTKPYPGAFFLNKNKTKIIIWRCEAQPHNHNKEPGTIIYQNNSWAICCRDGLIFPKHICVNGIDTDFIPAYFN